MGFYSPEVIVNHARHQGIEIMPVHINRSKARCTVEDGKIRLGFRYIKAVGETAWQRIEEERNKGPYTSLSDFHYRTGIERQAIENLILAGAFDYLGVPKRELLWELGLIMRQACNMLPPEFPAYQIALPGMTPGEEIAAEYQVQGLSARHHPMEVFRREISRDGILSSAEVANLFPDTKVRVAGCVVSRQAPMTARGCVFITLEDEYGLVNIVLRRRTYEKYRQVARMEPFIVVEGVLQKKDGILNIVAERLIPLREERERQHTMYPAPAAKARNFA
jgi:error-prone DNA polymerase